MKKESNFVLYAFLAIVAIGVGLYALLVPKSYDWSTSPTDLNSEEPFAQKVMHDVLSHSFSHGYRVSDDLDSTLKQQEKNDSNENLIVFALANSYAPENNLEQLQRMARLARNGRPHCLQHPHHFEHETTPFWTDRQSCRRGLAT